jgi:outer membrane protein assembly factor BamB
LMVGTLFDYFHLNTITVIPENGVGEGDARFRAGNLLICFRNVNQIGVLDKDTWEILWVWGEGELEWPHHPTMLDNGNILLFDNGAFREFTTVLELNPVTERVEWKYNADPPTDFYSYSKGSAQRLPNGNTLICDADNGRAFEVTRAGETVWEWHNPARELARRVTVYRMTRLPPDLVEPLLGID